MLYDCLVSASRIKEWPMVIKVCLVHVHPADGNYCNCSCISLLIL